MVWRYMAASRVGKFVFIETTTNKASYLKIKKKNLAGNTYEMNFNRMDLSEQRSEIYN